jgi:chromosome partitioning protein
MYVITFANPKGGSGKTTSAMLLAEQIANAGGKVTILDCDPNQNIVLWAKLRSKEGRAVRLISSLCRAKTPFWTP